ncbi:MAG: M48 family metallopeptidase [Candidatus Thiodiazotropha weberae]|nr:M48 family metallopeptidase [Candidatus Thiodiazotropha lotti]MCG8011440.1 M48 family metallopeptidase [Candidatus Thiodiazotropha lotti]MCG8019107.1 M48 family metallopeptidase [Candidatus Thiodiazotropha lotti]MCW4206266.1 M48 family metallopeptidase [Candidatus Thiodiazotropha lotti]MCW4210905.1 M48 family metallopeptidase [Candidatus Thiodiazotropha lotti]
MKVGNCLTLILILLTLVACATSPTGRKQLMIVSEEMAINSSKTAYTEMLKPYQEEGKLDNDPLLKARVARITGRLIAQAVKLRPETEKWAWSMKLLDDPETVNAWAMAGGKMALYTGLVEKIKPTDDELAQVLAHEISHALAKHTAEKMSVAMASQLGIAAVAASTDNKAVVAGSLMAAKLAIDLPNSRTAEEEADRIGIELAAKAGYDPRAAVTLWKKMGEVSGGRTPEFLSTHPSPANRAETLGKLADKMMPYFNAPGERPSFDYQ